MKLEELYESILHAGGLTIDKEGFVSVGANINDKTPMTPLLVGGKRLVMPTAAHLADPNKDNKLLFHPLSENILRGESEVISKLRSTFTVKMNYTLLTLMTCLLDIAASVEGHKRLNPDQLEFLSVVGDVDAQSCKVFMNIWTKAAASPGNDSFIKFYLKRGGIINDKKFSRAGIITFPFYEELQKEQETYYGVKLRKKDRAAFIAMLEYILPNISKPEAYNRGSDSEVGPFLDALMKTFMAVSSCFNDVVELFQDKIEGYETMLTNSEWVPIFDNLSVMINEIRRIPMQTGNDGQMRVTEQSAPPPVQNALAYQPPAPQQFAPPPPTPGLNVYTPQPVNTWQQPQQPQQQWGGQQWNQPPAPPPVSRSKHGIDFKSVLANRPDLAQTRVHMPATMLDEMAKEQNAFGYNQMHPQFQQNQFQPQQDPNGPRSRAFNGAPQQNFYGNGGGRMI